MTRAPIVEVERVTKRFGRHVALHDVTLTIDEGSTVGLVGPNGSGKTTLLHVVLGLVRPSSGAVRLFGSPPHHRSDIGRRVGWVFESVGLHPGFTALESLTLLGEHLAIGRHRVAEVLDLVGLTAAARRPVGAYSLGMRQRLSIGAALLAEPEVLLLDEPTTGLDPTGIRWLRDVLVDLRGRGCTLIVSSHLLDELAKLADVVVVLREGNVVASGAAAHLTASPAAVEVDTPDAVPASRVLTGLGLRVEPGGDGLRVWGASTEEVTRVLVEAGVRVRRVAEVERDLETAVLDVLARPEAAP